jgi:hypothetical protein
MHPILKKWQEQFFNNNLSSEVVTILEHLDFNNQEITDFLSIYFNYLYLSGSNPHNFSPQLAQWYVGYLDNYMLSAWQRVPPITASGRLRHIDALFVHELGLDPNQSLTALDIGCGYPPETTLDMARNFPAWNITGIDPGMPEYILYDAEGHAACYDREKKLIYIQRNPKLKSDQFDKKEKHVYINKFNTAWQELKDKPLDATEVQALINNRSLIYQPIRHYQSTKLTFYPTSLQAMDYRDHFDIIRCFAVFIYLSLPEIKQGLLKIQSALHENGYFVYGIVYEFGTGPMYVIYQKKESVLKAQEFAFSIDHLSQLNFTSFWGFNPDYPEKVLLAKLLNTINKNAKLALPIQKYVDEFLKSRNLAYRNDQGYLVRNSVASSAEYSAAYSQLDPLLKKEFMPAVVQTLQEAGWNAYENKGGDVAVSLAGISNEFDTF